MFKAILNGLVLRTIVFTISGVLLLVLIAYNLCFKNFKVIGEKLECSNNSPFEFEYLCELDTFDNVTQYWSFEGAIPEGLEMPRMMAQITTLRKVGSEWIPMYFHNQTIDVCKYSGTQLSKVMINKFLPAMNNPDVSNLNRPCPFKGPVYLRKFTFDEMKLPRNLEGEWKVQTKCYAEGFEEFTFDVTVHVRLESVGYF